jgi:beta-1,4-N-acetylglucosaminyltransferase
MSYIFVTVGSTSFESLIQNVDNKHVLSKLKSLGYTKIIYQIGSGKYVPSITHILPVECFKYKPTILNIIQGAGLVICHAGVGTVMETLKAKKSIIVVPNPSLMDNHQCELANTLAIQGYVVKCMPENIIDQLSFDFSNRTSWIPTDLSPFNTLIQKEIKYLYKKK